MFREALNLLNELKFEIVSFFPGLVDAVIDCVERILRDSYLQRKYVEPPEDSLTPAGQEIRKNYRRLVSLQDGFKAVRKARSSKENVGS